MSYSRLALLIWLGICLPAQAQQVSNPALAPVPTNAQLKATAGTPQGVIRLGFYAPGDGGYQRYNWSATNCTAADDGAQVQPVFPSTTGCWIADIDKSIGANVRIWGAKGDNVADDGPAFRKACAWALSFEEWATTSINIPTGIYALKTADPRGNGALYTGTGNDDGRACSLIGSQSNVSYPASGVGTTLYASTALILGPGVNRPLIYIPKQGSSPHIKYLTLDGNKSGQTGWAGGPLGKLYTVQSEAVSGAQASPETGPIFTDVVMMSGYNGNLYNGSGRNMRSDTLWSNYSGQTVNDCSIEDWGYDAIHMQPGFGSNVGCGIYIPQGIQYTLFGGSTWQNTGAGLKTGGLTSNYINIFGMNFHQNAYGILNENQPPYTEYGFKAGAISCNGCTFDGNVGSDIYVKEGAQVNKQIKLIAPSFLGHSTGGALPPYNILIEGTTTAAGIVDVVAPSLSQTGAPFTTAFTNSPTTVYCTGFECPSTAFLPTLGNGAATYNVRQGYAMRFGHLVHLSLVVSTTSLGSPTGNMSIGNIPYSSSTQVNYVSPCAVGTAAGWTAPAGSSWLTAQIPANANFIQLFRNSVVGGGNTATSASEWGAGAGLTISCTYVPQT